MTYFYQTLLLAFVVLLTKSKVTLSCDSNPTQNAPHSFEETAKFIQDIDYVEFSTDVAFRPELFDSIPLLRIPESHSILRIEGLINKGVIVPERAQITITDEIGTPFNAYCILKLCRVNSLALSKVKNSLNNHVTARQKGIVVLSLTLFGFIPYHYKMEVDLEVISLIDALPQIAENDKSTTSEVTNSTDQQSLFNMSTITYSFKFSYNESFFLNLNEGTSVSLNDNGFATILINGTRFQNIVTVTGEMLILSTPVLDTEASDLDLQVTLDLTPEGLYHIAFNPSTLRGLELKSSDISSPKIDSLKITAKDYDFIITVNPHNSFTFQDLIDNISDRIGNPALMEKFRRTLTEKASVLQEQSASSSESIGELIVDSSQWNVVDYLSHGFRNVAKEVNYLPHIRKDLDDPAIQNLAKNGAIHLQRFIASKQLQYASVYDIHKLKRTVELTLSRHIYDTLGKIDPDVMKMLMNDLKFSKEESSLLSSQKNLTDKTKFHVIKINHQDSFLRDHFQDENSKILLEKDDLDALEHTLIRLGDKLNKHERSWLREAFVNAGGMESEGRVYALAVNLIKELHARIKSDENAPQAMLDVIENVPVGEDLDMMIAVGAVNVQGAIWASNGVLKHGWLPVSERLETRSREIYGKHDSSSAKDIPFVRSSVRFIGNGEEFFQQIYQLINETERFFMNDQKKCTIILHHWAFEAIKGSTWALKVANRLRDLAMEGFKISMISDGKAGPSTRGQVILRSFSKYVLEHNGLGLFHVHSWLPTKHDFPTGTHVKYFGTPLGFIVGGSNLGDHYSHWTDTNILLRGNDIVKIFGDHHFAILQEQRSIGHTIPEFPPIEPIPEENSWNPLQVYQYHNNEKKVFDTDWHDVNVRVIRDKGGDDNDRILVENIALIDAAKPGQTIYIINCYFIITQPVQESPLWRVFKRALERGVNIEILTNTHDSIDEKVTASPMHDAFYFMMKLASDIFSKAKSEGKEIKTGIVTVHFPDKLYIPKK